MVPQLTRNERDALEDLKAKVQKLSRFLSNTPPPRTDDPKDWYVFLSSFKEDLGNIHNNVSFLATMMAKAFLQERFELNEFDSAAKPQGAAGLDLDVRAQQGSRIIGEVKTTSPYKSDDLGAQQKKTFTKDADKLSRNSAEYKFFFVTERTTFEILKKPKYRGMFKGIRVVLLPGGDEIAA